MSKDPKNHQQRWTKNQVNELENLAERNTPTRVMALKLGRTEDAIRNKASEEDISLKPTNQRPYGTGGRRRGR